MKNKRHLKILNLIKRDNISTQQELVARLQETGIEVTQATISRDIKKLGLIKVPDGRGNYKYSYPDENNQAEARNWLKKMLQNFVVDMDYSENIILLKTVNGTAGGLGVAIDNSDLEGIMGTVAGDDTIMIVAKPKEKAPEIFNKFKNMLK